jgi:hypothetical protein
MFALASPAATLCPGFADAEEGARGADAPAKPLASRAVSCWNL